MRRPVALLSPTGLFYKEIEMSKLVIEMEETVVFSDFKTVRHRVSYKKKIAVSEDAEAGVVEEIITDGFAVAGGALRKSIRSFMKSVDRRRLQGGLSHQYVYLDGRKRRREAE